MAMSLPLRSLPYPREYRGTNTPIPLSLRIEASSMPVTECGCWIWVRQLNDRGYGLIDIQGRERGAHRVSYQVFRGPIPPGLYVCHHCDVRSCVNPDHLFLGTHLENMADMKRKGRHFVPKWSPKGTRLSRHYSKLTPEDVFYIRNSGIPIQRLRGRYPVHVGTLYAIRSGTRWPFIPFAKFHSPEAAPQPNPQVKPAPATDEESAKGAGTSQSPDAPAEQRVPSGEKRQATEPGASALHGSSGLPEGWRIQYAKALSEAKASRYLKGVASSFWNTHGGWTAHKSGPNAATATAIYDAYANHFSDSEVRNRKLFELGAMA